jgi:hypothetical protein
MAETTARKSMAIPLTAFAVGAVVAILVGVFGRVHEPTLDGTTTLGYLEVGTLPDGAKVSTRTFVHGLLGCAVVGAMVVKVVAVRSRRAPGWFLPVAGGLLFSLLVLAVLTSAAWYIGAKGWPSRAG